MERINTKKRGFLDALVNKRKYNENRCQEKIRDSRARGIHKEIIISEMKLEVAPKELNGNFKKWHGSP